MEYPIFKAVYRPVKQATLSSRHDIDKYSLIGADGYIRDIKRMLVKDTVFVDNLDTIITPVEDPLNSPYGAMFSYDFWFCVNNLLNYESSLLNFFSSTNAVMNPASLNYEGYYRAYTTGLVNRNSQYTYYKPPGHDKYLKANIESMLMPASIVDYSSPKNGPLPETVSGLAMSRYMGRLLFGGESVYVGLLSLYQRTNRAVSEEESLYYSYPYRKIVNSYTISNYGVNNVRMFCADIRQAKNGKVTKYNPTAVIEAWPPSLDCFIPQARERSVFQCLGEIHETQGFIPRNFTVDFGEQEYVSGTRGLPGLVLYD
ncbi:hypothetical protein FACS1894188_10280 [Clostridia bacterium]|nr:hypothetical protein FACS1894188_10280 [Clostridia bacterium]